MEEHTELQTLIRLVKQMRAAQNKYFKAKRHISSYGDRFEFLAESKIKEKAVDDYIKQFEIPNLFNS